MSKRPQFQRKPRLYPDLPSGDVEIPGPPPKPTQPTTSLISVLLPGALAIAMLVATISMYSGSSTNSTLMMLSGGFTVVSSLVTVGNYVTRQVSYRREVREREEKYHALLASRREQLTVLCQQQQIGACQIDPNPEECLNRASAPLDQRLWERAPDDKDFLALRLGLGKQPFLVKVKVPKQEGALEPDPLLVEAQTLASEFAEVEGHPIRLPLVEAGAAGIVGPRHLVLNAVRALCMQLAAHHSPDEVKIIAVFPREEAEEWQWLRWLPHVWTDDHQHRYLAMDKDAAHDLLSSLNDLLGRRRAALSRSGEDRPKKPLPYLVFVLADPALVEKEPILPVLLNEGSRLGAIPVLLADRFDALRQGCRVAAEVGGSHARLIWAGVGSAQVLFAPDEAPLDLAERFARTMAPIQLRGLKAAGEIPNSVHLLGLFGVSAVEELEVASRWRKNEPFRTMSVPLGLGAGAEPLSLDVHERGHGPHGLVAGTTGSGKSELLLSLLTSLSINFDPQELVFVVVDYKGGGMANAFSDLPHLVGTITNLQGNLATRALSALRSELHRREEVLAAAGVNALDKYQRKRRHGEVQAPLPHLVIVVDEFAELATDQPDFMKELVATARVGRSLGVHLILATQKPAGVVNEQIWANSRFRMCLRVERPEDSREVLKCPDAADITRPGLTYLQVGNNELFVLFQAAWGGAPYSPGPVAPSESRKILAVALDGARRDLRLSTQPIKIQAPMTELQAVVEHIAAVAAKEKLQRLPGPWLRPLPDHVPLDMLRTGREGWDGTTWQPSSGWLEPVVGLVDDPRHQYQGALPLELGKEGHLAIYGAPGTGKTTLLQTLIMSLALDHTPEEVNLYLLDFGGRLLTAFKPLPHVGGVVLTDEADKLDRLLRFLLRELEARKERFAHAGVATLQAYRSATGETVPAMVVLLDNYDNFASTYPDLEDPLTRLTREGGNLGIHLVLTATGPSSVRTRVSNNITQAVALQLAEAGDYSIAVGRTEGLRPAPVPGRGLVKGTPPLEFQTALPVDAAMEAERPAVLRKLIQRMASAWPEDRPRARPIPELPDVVSLAQLVPPRDAWDSAPGDGLLSVPVGLDVDTLEPVCVDLTEGPHFLITGPVQCGKTTFLQAWLLALAERSSPQQLQMYLVDFRQAGLYPLQGLPHKQAFITDDDRFAEALSLITNELRNRRQALDKARRDAGGLLDNSAFIAQYPAIVMAFDDLDVFLRDAADSSKERMAQMVRRERGLRFHILVASANSDLGGWEDLVKALKELQCGFLLGSSEHNDLQIFNMRVPHDEAGKTLPPGQGYFSRRGRQCKVKVATAQVGSPSLVEWIQQLSQRASQEGNKVPRKRKDGGE